MFRPFAEKTAVVTGSSKGIGRAVALRLAQGGANVIIHGGSNEEAAKSVVRQIEQESEVRARWMLADLSRSAAVAPFVADAWAWQGHIDIWVNNAGADVLTGDSAAWTFEEKLRLLWDVDVLGTIQCSRDVGQRMKRAGRGVILNVGWDQAWEGMEGDSGEMFATTKGAVMAFSKSLAKSLAPEVRVNCLAPGWIRTDWGDGHASDYWQQRAVQESLRNRWGTPEDIAEAACFLASDAADFVNGQVLPVNGGFRVAHRDKGRAT